MRGARITCEWRAMNTDELQTAELGASSVLFALVAQQVGFVILTHCRPNAAPSFIMQAGTPRRERQVLAFPNEPRAAIR